MGKHFFPLETRCNHDIWDKQEEVEYIIPWEDKFSEADTQVYSHEGAVEHLSYLHGHRTFCSQSCAENMITDIFYEHSVENSTVCMTE